MVLLLCRAHVKCPMHARTCSTLQTIVCGLRRHSCLRTYRVTRQCAPSESACLTLKSSADRLHAGNGSTLHLLHIDRHSTTKKQNQKAPEIHFKLLSTRSSDLPKAIGQAIPPVEQVSTGRMENGQGFDLAAASLVLLGEPRMGGLSLAPQGCASEQKASGMGLNRRAAACATSSAEEVKTRGTVDDGCFFAPPDQRWPPHELDTATTRRCRPRGLAVHIHIYIYISNIT